ncbi:MAG: cation transporter [Treponema sp.]|nr:cation transporter [Treponema sp.]
MKGNREKTIIRTSVLSIAANILLAGFKASVGLISNSIAIVSDAINNLSDALSSIITIVGTKLAGKAPDKKHPYGYGRIEYMTSFVVSAIVLYAGITALVESIKKIVHPEKPDYSIATLVILVGGILVKLVLGIFVKKKGRAVNSDSLVASGSDAFNDAILSASVLVSAVVYMIFKINLEAYVGAILSLFIIKSGLELIKESVDNILGMRVESALSKNIKKDVASEEEVLGAFDLILTNYGPDRYLGSIHIEVRDTLSVSELDKVSRKITRKILEKYGVVLHTVGIYSVNTKDSNVVAMRDEIRDIVFSHDGILQMHGFYASEEEKTISFDIIIDFKIKNREEVWQKICTEVQSRYADYNVTIALDVDASD